MKLIDKIIQKLESCIKQKTYEALETDIVEIKNIPGSDGDWKEIYKTICAFLNTQGGILILGVKEDKEKRNYSFGSGYSENIEPKIKEVATLYTDEHNNKIDVSQYISNFQIKDFLDRRIGVWYIENLSEDAKFIFFNKVAWERKITGEHKIDERKIESQRDFKKEIENSRELKIVEQASLSEIDIDKINEFISLLNKEIKIESIKVDVFTALPFLQRKGFVMGEKPTILGMLVCGKYVNDFLGQRAQVDCFVDTPIQVAQDKKIIQDNVLQLMERSLGYVMRNIQIGISAEKGGISKPEYPEGLIRESINNSLAHRDYSINKFIIIAIKPNQYIEIRNPGSFKAELVLEHINHEIPIRRIIPNSKPKNPKLADILHIFDKWEGRGRGMATLTNEALANSIDLPYYKFHSKEEMSLVIPRGKLLDNQMKWLFESFSGLIMKLTDGELLTEEQKLVFSYIYKSEEANLNYRYTILLTPDNNHLQALSFLERRKLIEKHPLSDSIHPVFLVRREFINLNYSTILRNKFGRDYDSLPTKYKDVLKIVYQYNQYSIAQTVSANEVGNILFLREQTLSEENLRAFENFKRTVRGVFNKLEAKKLVIVEKQERGINKYILNDNYMTTLSIF